MHSQAREAYYLKPVGPAVKSGYPYFRTRIIFRRADSSFWLNFRYMTDDGLAWFENVLGAASNSDQAADMSDARCPKCNASDFVKIADVYVESLGRLEEGAEPSDAERIAGLTDAQILQKFGPPRQKSALVVALMVGVPLAGIAYYVYHRFGDIAGQSSFVVVGVLTLVVLMTKARSFSDKHYYARRRWNRMFICRQCGQVVAS